MNPAPAPHPPGIADIEAGPSGPQVAAVFDFDGTILQGYSVLSFLAAQLRQRQIGLAELGRAARSLLEGLAGADEQRDMLARGIAQWRGHRLGEMLELGQLVFERELDGSIFPEMRALIDAHRRKGHTLLIASSATSFQVEPAARALGIDTVLCTRLEHEDGVLTGRVDGPLLWGRGKASAVRDLAAARGLELSRSYFYADGDEDEALMHLVGSPRPVNPRPQLERVALRRGWPVLRFTSRGPITAEIVLRNLAATAGLVPVLAGAAAIRLLTGDRRQAANLLTSTLPEMVLSFGQVRLNVRGEEHLWSQRPAVFIWNHRNVFDAQIVAKLVKRDFGAVAKKELRTDPLFAVASQFMDIAFVDRQDHRAAMAALEPVTRLLTEGCSMLVAPEGTRVSGGALGEFKKGAFRMAMAAGVPIVPIVVRNAEDLGSRSSMFIRPGVVDVAVLPPVTLRGWTRANLDARIASVRQSFVDALANWPQGDAPVPPRRRRQ